MYDSLGSLACSDSSTSISLRRYLARRGQSRATAGAAGEGRSCRHARSAGHRGVGGRHRRGHAVDRLRAAVGQELPWRVPAGPAKRYRRRGRRSRRIWPTRRYRLASKSRPRCRAFLGKIAQRPPAHSGSESGGQRAYDLRARSRRRTGARQIEIHDLRLVDYDYPSLHARRVCSAGTYVRSLGRDLAECSERRPSCRPWCGPPSDPSPWPMPVRWKV